MNCADWNWRLSSVSYTWRGCSRAISCLAGRSAWEWRKLDRVWCGDQAWRLPQVRYIVPHFLPFQSYQLTFNRENKLFMGLSFETISSTGANAAVIHYSPPEKGSKVIEKKQMYLCDSGGQYCCYQWRSMSSLTFWNIAQYLDGTTDVTRTLVGQSSVDWYFLREANTVCSISAHPTRTKSAHSPEWWVASNDKGYSSSWSRCISCKDTFPWILSFSLRVQLVRQFLFVMRIWADHLFRLHSVRNTTQWLKKANALFRDVLARRALWSDGLDYRYVSFTMHCYEGKVWTLELVTQHPTALALSSTSTKALKVWDNDQRTTKWLYKRVWLFPMNQATTKMVNGGFESKEWTSSREGRRERILVAKGGWDLKESPWWVSRCTWCTSAHFPIFQVSYPDKTRGSFIARRRRKRLAQRISRRSPRKVDAGVERDGRRKSRQMAGKRVPTSVRGVFLDAMKWSYTSNRYTRDKLLFVIMKTHPSFSTFTGKLLVSVLSKLSAAFESMGGIKQWKMSNFGFSERVISGHPSCSHGVSRKNMAETQIQNF